MSLAETAGDNRQPTTGANRARFSRPLWLSMVGSGPETIKL